MLVSFHVIFAMSNVGTDIAKMTTKSLEFLFLVYVIEAILDSHRFSSLMLPVLLIFFAMPKYNWFCRLIKIVNVYSWTAYIALQTI
jgi:ABC-type multidrug transport system permease subunit